MFPQGTGWIPDRPDPRDYGPGHKNLTPVLGTMQEPLVQATAQPAAGAHYPDLTDLGLGTQQ
jgi:hypothetical protein